MSRLKTTYPSDELTDPATSKRDIGRSWADGLLFFTVLFWGINFSVVKFALADLPPLVFNSIRFLIASGTMVLVTLATGHTLKFQRRHVPYLIGLGLVGHSIYQLLFVFGINFTTAANSSLILATVPVWVALFGTLAGVERLTMRGWLGVILSLGGIVLIILGGDRQAELRFGGATLGGDLLILLATLAWSTYTLAIRPMTRHYPSVAVTSISTLIGTVPLILVSMPALVQFDWPSASMSAWLAVLFSGVFGIALAYIFWINGVSHLGSARTSLYSNMVPAVALLTAWLWLGETLTLQQGAGVFLALIGVALARQYTYPVEKSKI